MSKALDYLIKARPDAMQSYFTFLKQAGSHLDKKTAALISVITKVHAKTANGLRQYLPRALKEGASPDEIIDALLFAMPALGFSKIVWAMDVILEMDLPEFRHHANANTHAKTEWIELADEAKITPDNPFFTKAGKNSYVIAKDGAACAVFSTECPHQKNVILETSLNGNTLTCPFHEWKFELPGGACVSGGPKPLKKIESRTENGKVWIRL
jgi:nitrite reductase/ring-hydroxylating ferredoxin subunit/alkylhydroperoxidase/carboxymuconolactone decarboxylase family protein YurZ